ncbi:MAG: phosphatase PAP2 family protein [Ruminococcaceae bacterium]|nr:phosphatase PAP2 family protein [Oscillospiraceae bacterium]
MKKENKKNLYIAICFLSAFLFWTAAVSLVDVRAIGPEGSSVGFAKVNSLVHKFLGVHMDLYIITDWLSLIPVGVVLGFAYLGLLQWIKRKKFSKIDYSILVLGGFYVVVMAVYVLFEIFVVNYRPLLINGCLEASYPSSTTMLVMCIMPTAMMQTNCRIKNPVLRKTVNTAIFVFIIFMVFARLVSGVHWLTDIVGGALLSTGLVKMYSYIIGLKQKP